MPETCVGIFSSIHFVLKAEKLLKKSGLAVITIPVPRKISADCGIAISFSVDDVAGVKELLKKKKVRLQGIYTLSADGTYCVVD
jgi:predicted secreted protein